MSLKYLIIQIVISYENTKYKYVFFWGKKKNIKEQMT